VLSTKVEVKVEAHTVEMVDGASPMKCVTYFSAVEKVELAASIPIPNPPIQFFLLKIPSVKMNSFFLT